MNSGFAGTMLLVIFSMVLFAILLSSSNHLLNKDEWNCVQSRIIDPKNVDKTECLVYKKAVKEDVE